MERKGEDASWSVWGGGRGLGVTPALLGVCRQTGLHPGLGTVLAMCKGRTPHWVRGWHFPMVHKWGGSS